MIVILDRLHHLWCIKHTISRAGYVSLTRYKLSNYLGPIERVSYNCETKRNFEAVYTSGVTQEFFAGGLREDFFWGGGGVQQIQLSTEGGENRDLGAVAL
jgi:hypothetical protein